MSADSFHHDEVEEEIRRRRNLLGFTDLEDIITFRGTSILMSVFMLRKTQSKTGKGYREKIARIKSF